MAPKRRLSTVTPEPQEGDALSDEDTMNVKKVRWETIAPSGDNDSESEESEVDNKVDFIDCHVLSANRLR